MNRPIPKRVDRVCLRAAVIVAALVLACWLGVLAGVWLMVGGF